ncbi:MAG: RHS repeat protein, partial [Phycisphaerae bacterium]|nr:RHS repeat protein [Phycisphaerae bacterium]
MRISNVCARWLMLATLLGTAATANAQISGFEGDGVLNAPYRGTITSLREATMDIPYGEVMNHVEPDLPPPTSYVDWGIVSDIEIWADEPWDRSVLRLYEDCDASGNEINLEGRDANNPAIVELDAPYIIVPDIIKRFSFKAIATKTLSVRTFHVHFRYDKVNLYDTVPPQQADPTRIVRVAPMTGSFTALPGEEEIFHYGTTVLDVSVGSARLTVPIGSTADTIGAAYNYYDRNLGPSAAATSDVVFPGAAESVFIPGDGQFDSENGAYAKWAGFGTPWPGYLIGYHGRPDIYGPDGTHFDVLYSTASLSARHFTYVRPCGLGELRPAAQKYVRDGDYTARIEDQATPNANWIELDRDTPGQVRVDTSDDRHWTILYDDTTKVITGVYPGTNPSTAKGARYFSWRNNSGTIIPLSEGGRVTEVRTEATEGQGILYRFVYDSEGDLREEWRNIDEVLTKTVDHIVIDGTHRRRKEYVAGGCRQTDIAYNATYPSLIESITTHSGDGDSHVTQYVHDVGNLHGNVVIKEVTLPDSSVITHYYDKEVSQPVPSSFAEYGIRTKTVRTRGDSIITRDTEYQFHHSDGWSILLYYRPRLVKKRDGLGNEITYFYEPGGEDGDGTADRSADGLAGEMSNQLWTVLGPQTTTYDTVGTVGQRTAEVNYYYYDDQAGGSPDDRIGLLARKTVKTGVDASSSPTTITTTYDYDALRRITSETVDPTGEALQSEYFYCDTSTTQDRVVRDPDSYVTWTQYDGDGRIAATYCFLDPMTSTITPCTLPTDPYYGTTYTYNDEGWLEYLITDNKDASGTALTPATFTTQFVYDELGRVKQEIVDPGTGGIAQSTNTTYTWQGEIETQTDTFDRGVKRTYDGRGLLKTEMVLGLNKAETPLVTTYEFKLEGGTWVETVTAPTGAVHKKTYDGFGRVAWEERIAGPDGGQTVATWYGYDRASHITRTTVAENGTILSDTTAAYDESGLQYRVRQRLTDGVDNDDTDLMTVRTYDCAGNVIQEAALGDSSVDDPTPDRVIAAHHDTAGRLDEITDGRGGQITFARDGRGNVTEKQVLLDAVASTYAVTTTTYDAFGRATRVRSPADAADVTGLRHYRDFAYNTRGDLLSVTAYETAGADPNPATDTPVRRTQFAYDNVGRRIQEAVMATPASPNDPPDPAEDRVVDLAFFDDGVKDERWTYNIGPGDTLCSLVTKVDYDPLGRVSKTTDPSASFVQNTYDTTNGRLTQRKTNDGVGERTFTLIYDGHDRVKTHKAQGDPIIETKFEYDGLNRRTATIDPENVRTEVHFDLAGRQSELIEDKGGELQRTTTFAYNRLNQLTTQTVENRDSANTPLPDQVTKYAHDSLGRLRGIRYPDSSCPVPDNDCVDCVRLGYDVAGRPATRRDQRGWTTAFAHDPRGLLLSRTTTTPTTVVMDSFAYDAIGQLRDARRGTPVDDDAYALAEMDYTPLGYLEEERQSILTGTVHTVGYEHDPAGNRTELSYSGGGVLTYTATPLNQVDTISLNGSLLADYDYHGDGHRLASRTVTTPSGSYTAAYGYDDHRRTNAIRNTFTAGAAETVLSDYSFTHDTRDNPLERRAGSAGGLPSFMADERTYDVDSLSRLTDTYYAETGTHEHTTLDLVGNREQYTSRDGEQIDYTLANPANQYATIGGANVEYDPAGNLSVDEAGRSYFYDERNRLIEVRAADGTTTLASYTYDALGRRTSFEDPVAGVTTYYYYAGNSVIEEYDDAGNRLRYHVNGGQYIDEQLATVDETSGEATYY